MLILTKYIAQHELKPLRRYFDLSDILEGAQKVLKNLAIETKSPILIRLKKDKIFGKNMAMNNSKVAKQISSNLDYVLEDIKNKRYEEFS